MKATTANSAQLETRHQELLGDRKKLESQLVRERENLNHLAKDVAMKAPNAHDRYQKAEVNISSLEAEISENDRSLSVVTEQQREAHDHGQAETEATRKDLDSRNFVKSLLVREASAGAISHAWAALELAIENFDEADRTAKAIIRAHAPNTTIAGNFLRNFGGHLGFEVDVMAAAWDAHPALRPFIEAKPSGSWDGALKTVGGAGGGLRDLVRKRNASADEIGRRIIYSLF